MIRGNLGDNINGSVSSVTTIRMNLIYSALMDDICLVYPALKSGQEPRKFDPTRLNQSERRSLVRAIFSLVEGMSFCLRVGLLEDKENELPHTTVMALQELQIEIANEGQVKSKPIKTSIMNLLRLTVREYSSMYPGELKIKCAGAEFEGLVKSVRVRDRLMHPRSLDDLTVTDGEIKLAVVGMNWFQVAMAEMILVQATHMRVRLKDLENNIKARRAEEENLLQRLEALSDNK